MSKIKYVFLILPLLVIFISTLFLQRIPTLKINPAILTYFNSDREYLIAPKNSSLILETSPIAYPTVQTHPSSYKYFLINFKEKYSSLDDEEMILTFASKRVAELNTWANDFIILGNYKNSPQLNKWWATSEPELWEVNRFSYFNTWEGTLARYNLLIEKQIDILSKIRDEKIKFSKYEELNSYLQFHEKNLEDVIRTLNNKSDEEKSYITKITDENFKYLYKKATALITPYVANDLEYSLASINTDKEYGYYIGELDFDSLFNESSRNYTIKYNDENHGITSKNGKLMFGPILVRPNEKNLSFHLTWRDENLAEKKEWSKKLNEDQSFTYTLELPLADPTRKYLITFNYIVKDPVRFKLSQSYLAPANKKMIGPFLSREIIDEELHPHATSKSFKRTFTTLFDNEHTNSTITFDSKGSLDISRFDIHVVTLWEPEINLIKVPPQIYHPKTELKPIDNANYLLLAKNTTSTQDKYLEDLIGPYWKIQNKDIQSSSSYQARVTFWPKDYLTKAIRVSLACIAIFFLTIFLRKFSAGSKLLRMMSFDKLIQTYANTVKRIPTPPQLKFYILSFTTIGIGIDIFMMNIYYSKEILIVFSTLWALTIYAFRKHGGVTYTSSIILVLLCPVLLLLNQQSTAEKAAVWAVALLFVDTLHQITTTHQETDYSNYQKLALYLPSSKAFRFVSKIVRAFINFIYSTAKLAISPINYLIVSYHRKPKNRSEYLMNVINISAVTILYVLVIVVGVVSIVLLQNKIRDYNYNVLRLSRIPFIQKYEPKIVYASTHVILSGKEFGWKQGEQVKLYNQFGEVATDFWTNENIYFTVPLNWKHGKLHFWIEKPVNWEGEDLVAKSNIIEIELIPVDGVFGEDDAAFFEQLKNLDKETLRINNY